MSDDSNTDDKAMTDSEFMAELETLQVTVGENGWDADTLALYCELMIQSSPAFREDGDTFDAALPLMGELQRTMPSHMKDRLDDRRAAMREESSKRLRASMTPEDIARVEVFRQQAKAHGFMAALEKAGLMRSVPKGSQKLNTELARMGNPWKRDR